MEIVVFASGSKGNCTLVKTGASAILIDAGLSARRLHEHLASAGLAIDDLAGILVTHEHTDHISGLEVLLKKHDIPVYCNRGTAREIHGCSAKSLRIFETGASFNIADFSVRSFAVPHDANDPVGFRISHSEGIVGAVTDLGKVTRLVADALRGTNALLFESNYDEEMLANSPRPWMLKQRISGNHGHLSNTEAAEALAGLVTDDLAHLLLYHLSRECNTPDLALRTVGSKVTQKHVHIQCTFQDRVVKV